MPKAVLSSYNLSDGIIRFNGGDFMLLDVFGKNDYGYIARDTDEGIQYDYYLRSKQDNTTTPIRYPQKTDEWVVGSGSYVILQNRYRFE